MRTGQAWVFLEIGLGVVFVITIFCLCRYFDSKKVRRQRKREKAADEDCYQHQLAAQRERAMSIRKASLIREEHEMEAKKPLQALEENEEEKNEGDGKDASKAEEKQKSSTNSPAVSSKKEPPPSPKPAAGEGGKE